MHTWGGLALWFRCRCVVALQNRQNGIPPPSKPRVLQKIVVPGTTSTFSAPADGRAAVEPAWPRGISSAPSNLPSNPLESSRPSMRVRQERGGSHQAAKEQPGTLDQTGLRKANRPGSECPAQEAAFHLAEVREKSMLRAQSEDRRRDNLHLSKRVIHSSGLQCTDSQTIAQIRSPRDHRVAIHAPLV